MAVPIAETIRRATRSGARRAMRCSSTSPPTRTHPTNDGTLVDYPLTRDRPEAIVMATHLWNPGVIFGMFNDSPLGVWYSAGWHDWVIFHENYLAMDAGAAFNVEVLPPSDSVFTHFATAGNIISNFTVIDHPLTNENPNAILQVTPQLTGGEKRIADRACGIRPAAPSGPSSTRTIRASWRTRATTSRYCTSRIQRSFMRRQRATPMPTTRSSTTPSRTAILQPSCW